MLTRINRAWLESPDRPFDRVLRKVPGHREETFCPSKRQAKFKLKTSRSQLEELDARSNRQQETYREWG
jgi:hypothetical protein